MHERISDPFAAQPRRRRILPAPPPPKPHPFTHNPPPSAAAAASAPPVRAGNTTAVGEPLPGPEGRVAVRQEVPLGAGRGSAVFNLVTYPLAIGLGFGLFAGVMRMLF